MAEASKLPDFSSWLDNPYIICLEGDNLEKLKLKLASRRIEYVTFYEPDISTETSVAFFDGPNSRVVSSFKLAANGDNHD